jgi:hypothetical protein
MKRIIAVFLVLFVFCATAAADQFDPVDMQETVLSYEQFLQAEDGSRVCVEAYVQAAQTWKNGGITLYLQDRDHGAYYAYDITCGEADAELLSIPGTKIRLEGIKANWSGETEIVSGDYEILADESFITEPENVTELLGKSELAEHMNEKVAFRGLKIIGSKTRADEPEKPFLYDWNDLGSAESNSDLCFSAELNGAVCDFCVESDLCGNHTDVYKTVQGLQIGDVIDCEAFLYWYEGAANPHVTTVTVRNPESETTEPEKTETGRQEAELQVQELAKNVTEMEPAPAAKEGPWMRTTAQYSFTNMTMLTDESYPEVRLIHSYPYMFFSKEPQELNFLCFRGPEGIHPQSFAPDYAEYFDQENEIGYRYELKDRDSFESFLDRTSSATPILLDGSDGAAAYIDPGDQHSYGYAMITAEEFGKKAKLLITITMYRSDSRIPAETRMETLSKAITGEVERVRSEMHTEQYAPYWSCDYAGINMLDYSFERLLKFPFMPIEATVWDRGWASADFFPTRVDGTWMDGIYFFGGEAYAEFKLTLDSYSYAVDNLQQKAEGAEKLTLENGGEWIFYPSNVNDDGSIFGWYASKAVEGLYDSYDSQVYISLRFGGNRVVWENKEDCRAILDQFDRSISVVPSEENSSVPALPRTEEAGPAEEAATEALPETTDEPNMKPAEPGEKQAVTAESWICPNCGEENTSKFCGECGTLKPEPEPEAASWICPNCGTENEGKFCGECGTARPEPENRTWFCPNCGKENTSKFCTDCGNARPE